MKEHAQLFYLLRLLEVGADDSMVEVSTDYLAKLFNLSQQSASRVVSELGEEGYLYKDSSSAPLKIELTDKALDYLRDLRVEVEEAFNEPGVFRFRGEVFTGFGEGAYYMSQKPYRRQFYNHLGWDPHPGTLNLKLKEDRYVRLATHLRSLKGIQIMGFEDLERTYGKVWAWRATVEDDVEAAYIWAVRSVYEPDTAELISPANLRDELDLEDGDEVSFKAFLLSRDSDL